MPSTLQALLIFVLVLVPGFLFTAALRRSVSNLDRSDLRLLLGTIPAGILSHVVTFLWTARLLRIVVDDPERLLDNRRVVEVVVWTIVTIFVVPLALGAALGRLVKRPRVNAVLEQYGYGYINLLPSAWEYVFDKQEGYYVRIHLKDGVVIGGVYGTDSFAADPPRPSDIYLEEVWLLDEAGDFVRPLPTTRGVWVSQDEIAYMEFFTGRDLHEATKEHEHEREPTAGSTEEARAEPTTESTATRAQGESTQDTTEAAATAADAKAPAKGRPQLTGDNILSQANLNASCELVGAATGCQIRRVAVEGFSVAPFIGHPPLRLSRRSSRFVGDQLTLMT